MGAERFYNVGGYKYSVTNIALLIFELKNKFHSHINMHIVLKNLIEDGYLHGFSMESKQETRKQYG